MSDVKQPTVGRMVHYFPMNCSPADRNGTIKLPAMVQNDDMCPDLHVFQPNDKEPVYFMRSVVHKSAWTEGQRGYWEWPEIK